MWPAGTRIRVIPGGDRGSGIPPKLIVGQIYTVRGAYDNPYNVEEARRQQWIMIEGNDSPWNPARFEVVQEEVPEPEVVAPVGEESVVYTYLAYLKNPVRNTRFTVTHVSEIKFNEILRGYEQQGHTVVAKKRIKFTL